VYKVVLMCAVQNASVCPSDEDSQTFYVNASNGDSFRLKGNRHSMHTVLTLTYLVTVTGVL